MTVGPRTLTLCYHTRTHHPMNCTTHDTRGFNGHCAQGVRSNTTNLSFTRVMRVHICTSQIVCTGQETHLVLRHALRWRDVEEHRGDQIYEPTKQGVSLWLDSLERYAPAKLGITPRTTPTCVNPNYGINNTNTTRLLRSGSCFLPPCGMRNPRCNAFAGCNCGAKP